MIMDHFLDRMRELSAYRLGRSVLIILAALYIVMVATNSITYADIRPALITFVLRTLKADVVDALSVQSYKLLGFGLGNAARPTRYALICEEKGYASEAELAKAERLLRQQVDIKAGITYNSMMVAIANGKEQPVIILPKYGGIGVTRSCPVSLYQKQECTCEGRYNATERARIPASVLFGQPKPVD
jgi:hypothetical protein